MSLEFRFRRTTYVREHELVHKISNLLSAMSEESPDSLKSQKHPIPAAPSKRITIRNNSLTPRLTLFQFSLPVNLKAPMISIPQMNAAEVPVVQKTRIHRIFKPRVPTFIRPKPFRKSLPPEENLGRYQKILNLTQDLIDQDSLRGWN